jgi:IclR family transcriptional regulator, acetate operon repressor
MAMQQTPSVSERALQLLEIIAKAEQPPTLNELVSLVELPKATTHRFVSLLETLGFAQRAPDGRRYQVGHRLTALAIDVMRNSLSQAPRRAILASLVDEIGETCNITVLDGSELIYLDRVESDWPIQIRLSVGSRVPLHCTASGKLFLSLAPPQLRKALIESHPLRRHTSQTITDHAKLDAELENIRQTNVGTDNEEFIEGMAAAAVPVWDSRGKICATVAVHGPTGRLPVSRAIALTPALKNAAERLSQTFVSSPRES